MVDSYYNKYSSEYHKGQVFAIYLNEENLRSYRLKVGERFESREELFRNDLQILYTYPSENDRYEKCLFIMEGELYYFCKKRLHHYLYNCTQHGLCVKCVRELSATVSDTQYVCNLKDEYSTVITLFEDFFPVFKSIVDEDPKLYLS
jgi:hypothetical protein